MYTAVDMAVDDTTMAMHTLEAVNSVSKKVFFLKVSFANAVLEYVWSYIHRCMASIELYTQPM